MTSRLRHLRALALATTFIVAALVGTPPPGPAEASVGGQDSSTSAMSETPFVTTSLSSDQAVLSATHGTFHLSEDGSASLIGAAGQTLFQFPTAGTSSVGESLRLSYAIVGSDLQMTWTGTSITGQSGASIASVPGVTWGCVLSFLGLGFGTVGVVVATGGTAIVFILGVASYTVSVASLVDSCR